MKKLLFIPLVLLVSVLLSCATAPRKPTTRTLHTHVVDILAKMPALTPVDRDSLLAELVSLGAEGILEAAGMLMPPGTGDDTQVQYALSGLSHYVSRTGAGVERDLVIQAYLRALAVATDAEVKAFLIRQLQLMGNDLAIPGLSEYLGDARLCEPATQALLAIGTEAASTALFQALPMATGAQRITLVKALGELRYAPAVPLILVDASAENFNLRQVTLFALANIGDPLATQVFLRAMTTQSEYERAKATAWYLLFAQRRAEMGYPDRCIAICRELMASHSQPEQAHIYSSALTLLVQVAGEQAYDDIFAAAANSSKSVRVTALALAGIKSDSATSQKWLNLMAASAPEIRVDIITMLGTRGDKIALPAIIAALAEKNPLVQLAAIPAAAQLGDLEAIPAFMNLLKTDDSRIIDAVKQILLTLPPEQVIPAAVPSLSQVSGKSRAALLEVLALRRAKSSLNTVLAQLKDRDDSVRVAAIKALGYLGDERNLNGAIDFILKSGSEAEIRAAQATVVQLASTISDPEQRSEPVLTALVKAKGKTRSVLIAPLAFIGGKNALATVIAETKSPDAEARDQAIRTLAQWQDSTATDALLDIYTNTTDASHRPLALEGLVRLTGSSRYPDSIKLNLMMTAMANARAATEKNMILAPLAQVKNLAALQAVAPLLAIDSVANTAAQTCAQIALPATGADNGLIGPEVISILEQSLPVMLDEYERERVRKYLDQIKMPSGDTPAVVLSDQEKNDGFILLFNGQDLTGWQGNTKGYTAENGKIVLYPDRGDGNLFTEKEYADFVLRFEFKLTPGANNGLGIRTPLEGDAAYVGMELQILDNTALIYKDLKPYQYHGSIYGVVPAKREFLKPVGEWNAQEVIANGPKIQVILNGVILVDADIEAASKGGTMDGNDHPGLKRKSGYIGFLGHGSVVEFRNIRIKELK